MWVLIVFHVSISEYVQFWFVMLVVLKILSKKKKPSFYSFYFYLLILFPDSFIWQDHVWMSDVSVCFEVMLMGVLFFYFALNVLSH